MNEFRFESTQFTSSTDRRGPSVRLTRGLRLSIVVSVSWVLAAPSDAGEPDWEKVIEAVVRAGIPGDIERFADFPEWLQEVNSNTCGRPSIADPGEPWNSGCVLSLDIPDAQLIRAGAEGDLAWIDQWVGGFMLSRVVQVSYRLSESEVGTCSARYLAFSASDVPDLALLFGTQQRRRCRVLPISNGGWDLGTSLLCSMRR